MKCIKKLVALTLAAVLALTMLTACGGTPSVQDTTEATKQVVDNINAVRRKTACRHWRSTRTQRMWLVKL